MELGDLILKLAVEVRQQLGLQLTISRTLADLQTDPAGLGDSTFEAMLAVRHPNDWSAYWTDLTRRQHESLWKVARMAATDAPTISPTFPSRVVPRHYLQHDSLSLGWTRLADSGQAAGRTAARTRRELVALSGDICFGLL
jgi:hypothetical protein